MRRRALKVSCPANQILKKDVTFTCSITDDNGSTGVVTAVATDNQGNVSRGQAEGRQDSVHRAGRQRQLGDQAPVEPVA